MFKRILFAIHDVARPNIPQSWRCFASNRQTLFMDFLALAENCIPTSCFLISDLCGRSDNLMSLSPRSTHHTLIHDKVRSLSPRSMRYALIHDNVRSLSQDVLCREWSTCIQQTLQLGDCCDIVPCRTFCGKHWWCYLVLIQYLVWLDCCFGDCLYGILATSPDRDFLHDGITIKKAVHIHSSV